MLTVLRPGVVHTEYKYSVPLTYICSVCECLYSFYEEDLKTGYDGEEQYLYCPYCNSRNIIQHWWRYKDGKIQSGCNTWEKCGG